MDYTIQGVDGLFFHPETGEHLDICPFLECNEESRDLDLRVDVDDVHCNCLIYSDRPRGCREFPFTDEFVDLSQTVCPVVRDIRLKLKEMI
ncbi:hypothetical protein [Methanonatronarchaeum sp. AMET-Sl]|uniref:hypothetical protein n=1 Tax=Methanonatronarchaeum sp. AMET-Sl TaxID=3037654 RepID=UPI00244DFA97|nr:hypothetical protein [Methanonatronarchaeum sp. AMET-Sl]WGI16861.1 hypothetical protein QEN48_05025 [Methanonatronarchaeum sp. AMET-Sl]